MMILYVYVPKMTGLVSIHLRSFHNAKFDRLFLLTCSSLCRGEGEWSKRSPAPTHIQYSTAYPAGYRDGVHARVQVWRDDDDAHIPVARRRVRRAPRRHRLPLSAQRPHVDRWPHAAHTLHCSAQATYSKPDRFRVTAQDQCKLYLIVAMKQLYIFMYSILQYYEYTVFTAILLYHSHFSNLPMLSQLSAYSIINLFLYLE